MNSSDKTHDEHDRAGSRKQYVQPQLLTYGELREITQTVGGTGAMDGGSGTGMNKTFA